MPYSTSFDGAADTVFGATDGWTLVTATAGNLARLDGAGGLRIIGSSNPGSSHRRYEASADHYAEVVLGANFASGTLPMAALLTARGTESSSGFAVSYVIGSTQLRLNANGVQVALIADTACAAGDTVRIEASGPDQIRVYLNGVLKHTRTDTFNATETGVGFLARIGTVTQDDTIRSFASGSLAPADTAAPVITALTLTATGSSTLTGGFTSDEAGLVSAVLYPAIATEPSDAQVLLGNGADDLPAADFISGQAMTVGANTLLFTGADPETAYKFKVVARDAVPNVATGVAFAGTATTDPLPLLATVTLTQENGTTPNASVTGLRGAWWDAATPDFSVAPAVTFTTESTDASGVFTTPLTGTALTLGQVGTLLVYKTNGTAGDAGTLVFCGALATVN